MFNISQLVKQYLGARENDSMGKEAYLVYKPRDLSLIPGIHARVEGENQFQAVVL